MSAFLETLGGLLDFVINTISSLVWLVTQLPEMLIVLTESVGYAPTFLQSFLTMSIAATALFAVIRLL